MDTSRHSSVAALIEAALACDQPVAAHSPLEALPPDTTVAALASFAATALLYLRLRTGRDEREWLQLIAADQECPEALAS